MKRPAHMRSYIGQPIPRLEDVRLVAGQGRYTDDLAPADGCWAYVVRSPHPHAAIRAVCTERARGLPGVLAVLTAADYQADGLKPIPHLANPADAIDPKRPSFARGAGAVVIEIPQPVLAADRVRYVGEAVAVVIADTPAQAKDAAEAIEIAYEVLPAIASLDDALQENAPLLSPDVPGNICLSASFGDAQATERAFLAADLVVARDFPNQRIVNCQMEPRAAIGLFDPSSATYTVVSGSQGVVRHRAALSAALNVPPDKIRAISPDVGGGFGPRTSLYPESVLVAWGARRVGRPVRWMSERSEAFLTDFQGRDILTRAAAAFSAQGRLLAMRMTIDGNLGAYPASFAPLANCHRLIATVYDAATGFAQVRGVLTNSTPTSPYRGAGRPEATFAVERLLDLAADRLGIDRIEIRRKNIISKERLPYRNLMGLTYDSGDFLGNMEKALVRSQWTDFPARRHASRKNRRLRGIGIANYVEAPVGAPRERVVLTVTAEEAVELITGTQSTGQGHETVFAQVLADTLGVPLERIKVISGDSTLVEVGGGSHSARSMRLVGTLLCEASEKLIAKARTLAAEQLGVAGDDVRYADGIFTAANSNRTSSLFQLAAQSTPGILSVASELAHRIPVHPTGCAVCEVEVDPATGAVELQAYTSIDDVGRPINPLIIDGQVHGGIVQGIGQALHEGVVTDGSAQVLTASFMDYGLPRAHNVPSFNVELAEDPTTGNPLGIKGGGEGGITPATAAVINALVDALREHGVDHIDMPATAQRVWMAINRKTS
ncbi:MAG: xanthine dehydrogenase family protein molybdopterin-binding subunit [Xanthobacteraceae bacterium]